MRCSDVLARPLKVPLRASSCARSTSPMRGNKTGEAARCAASPVLSCLSEGAANGPSRVLAAAGCRARDSTFHPRGLSVNSTPIPGAKLRLSPGIPRAVDVAALGRRGDGSGTPLSATRGASLRKFCATDAPARPPAERLERCGRDPLRSTVPPPVGGFAPQPLAARNCLRPMGFCVRTGASSRLPWTMTAEKMIRLGSGVGNRAARARSNGGRLLCRCCCRAPGPVRDRSVGSPPPTGVMPTIPSPARGSTRPLR